MEPAKKTAMRNPFHSTVGILCSACKACLHESVIKVVSRIARQSEKDSTMPGKENTGGTTKIGEDMWKTERL